MSEFDTSNLADLQALMDSYAVHAIGATEPPTLMDIARFPHWENVYSNILAFVLNTEEAHGFGPLFIRSIIAAYRSNCPVISWREDIHNFECVEATDRVEREARTTKGKRIDILVECADFLVCVENKIRIDLNNPLDEYREHCKKTALGAPCLVLSSVLTASPTGDF